MCSESLAKAKCANECPLIKSLYTYCSSSVNSYTEYYSVISFPNHPQTHLVIPAHPLIQVTILKPASYRLPFQNLLRAQVSSMSFPYMGQHSILFYRSILQNHYFMQVIIRVNLLHRILFQSDYFKEVTIQTNPCIHLPIKNHPKHITIPKPSHAQVTVLNSPPCTGYCFKNDGIRTVHPLQRVASLGHLESTTFFGVGLFYLLQ